MLEKFEMPDFFYSDRWWSKLSTMGGNYTNRTHSAKNWYITDMEGLPYGMCVHIPCSTSKNYALVQSVRTPYTWLCWRIRASIWNTILRIVACTHYSVDWKCRCWSNCKWDYYCRPCCVWYNIETISRTYRSTSKLIVWRSHEKTTPFM